MRRALVCFLALLAAPALAEGERAGDFDYYVLALSWQPSWCALEGRARGAEDCDAGRGWVVHGLWPQYEEGWPSNCPSGARNPSRRETAAEADLFGSSGLAWYQWQKHGRCSGLSAADYFALVRVAYGRVERPPVFAQLAEPVRLPAEVVEEAFLEANPALADEMLRVTCRDGYVQEVRVCLTRALEPRACAPDSRADCTLERALLPPAR